PSADETSLISKTIAQQARPCSSTLPIWDLAAFIRSTLGLGSTGNGTSNASTTTTSTASKNHNTKAKASVVAVKVGADAATTGWAQALVEDVVGLGANHNTDTTNSASTTLLDSRGV